MCNRIPQLASFVLAAWTFTTAARASSTNFGDFAGDTVIYEDVLEVSTDFFTTAPQITGNTLDFTNSISQSNFQAEANAGTTDSVSSQLNAFIQARPGQSIDSFQIEVSGLSTVAGSGNTAARALLGVTARIVDVDGSELPDGPLILNTIETTLAEFDVADGTQNAADYTTATTISVADAAAAQFGITDPVTRVLWSITFTLEAEADTPGFSSIEFNSIDSFTVTVPEPATIAFFGLTGCFAARRRRPR